MNTIADKFQRTWCTAHHVIDDFGLRCAENSVQSHDLHATLLHLLRLDHTRHAGRDFRLTDVFGEVVKPILA